MSEHQHSPRPPRIVWVVIFALFSLLIASTGYMHYRTEEEHVALEKAQDLAVVGSLKAGQFAEWRKERLADAIRFAQGPALVAPTLQFLQRPGDPASRSSALAMLKLNRKGAFYQNTMLVSAEGDILLSAVDVAEPLPQTTRLAVRKSMAARAPTLSGIFRCRLNKTHIDTAAPLCDEDGQPRAVLILRADASDFLYPLIRFWPTDSASAETLLVQREGDHVVFLNDVRHSAGSALQLRFPVTQTQLPAVQAVLGVRSVIRGKDYRGASVLADVRPIADSDWFLVTKIDRSEILAEVHYRAKTIALFVGLGILLAAALTAVGYRRRQIALYRDLYRVEREQRVSHERFRTILYSIGDAVIVTDDQACVRQMNPVAEQLTGWREADALGNPLEDIFRIISEETRQPVENPVWRVLRDGQIAGLANHTLLVARDGTERPISDSGAPVRDESSSLNGVVLVFRDQTAEHHAQKALQESERRLTTLLNNLPGLAYRCERDEHWTMRFVSEGCLSLLGYAPSDLLDNARVTYAELIHPDDRGAVNDAITKAVLSHQAFTLEYRIRTLHGGEKWVWERGCAVLGADGKLDALEGFITDITERKQAAEEQAKLEDQLQQSQRIEAVGRLAGGIAHDFNNMLAVIAGTAESAMERVAPSDALHHELGEILKASKRSAGLVKQLLAFASKQPIMPAVLCLNDTIPSMLNMLGRLIGEAITLEWRPSPSLWNVKMDASQIDQILINLTVNARDAIAGVGQVCIETNNVSAEALRGSLPPGVALADYVLVAVSDNGCGMSPETQAHIFEPFFSTKEKGLGTGLGLATVYGIVKQNRGFIRVSSELGNGSRFSIFLPRADEPDIPSEARATRAHMAPPPEKDGEATLLLVEDEPALLGLTATLLKKAGYTVLTAEGPAKALEVARGFTGVIHLLLTDVVMPDMSGWALWQDLVRQRPTLKCLFMSGYTADIIAKHGVIQSDIHFLQKPFSKNALFAEVRKTLSS